LKYYNKEYGSEFLLLSKKDSESLSKVLVDDKEEDPEYEAV